MRKDLVRAQYIAWRIFLRDINARYRQTLLGYFWAFVPPIVVAAGFTWAGDAKVISVGQTPLPYPAYVMLSMVLWQTFAESIAGPVQAVAESKIMLAKVNFPREAIIVAKVLDTLFAFAIKLVLVSALFLWYRLPLSLTAMLVPFALVALIAFGTMVGLALAPFAALYQDLSKGLTILLGGWFFLTPVVYPLPQGDGLAATLVRWNPATPLLSTVRDLATGFPPSMLHEFAVVSGLGMLLLLLTWVCYRLAMPYVVERLSA